MNHRAKECRESDPKEKRTVSEFYRSDQVDQSNGICLGGPHCVGNSNENLIQYIINAINQSINRISLNYFNAIRCGAHILWQNHFLVTDLCFSSHWKTSHHKFSHNSSSFVVIYSSEHK